MLKLRLIDLNIKKGLEKFFTCVIITGLKGEITHGIV